MPQNLIRNVWAVGRNYADHAAEMKSEVPKTPMIFLKAGTTCNSDRLIRLPKWSKEVHYELEIAFRFDQNLGFTDMTLALDLTARDAQTEAKSKGSPWTLAKSFTGSCPLGEWISLQDLKDANELSFELIKNGKPVQAARADQMIFKPEVLRTYVRNYFPVVEGDVLLTGTPAGVGPLTSGDGLEATLRAGTKTLLTCFWDVE